MILECSHCGAPLDAKSQGGFIKCNYCNRSQRAQALHTQSLQTPPNWHPPPVWTPPPQYAIPIQQPLVYQKSGSGCGVLVAFGALSIALVIGLAAFFSLRPNPFGSSWDGKSTLSCSGVEQRTVENVVMTEALDDVIEASGICKLTIKNSDLKGDHLVTAEGSSEVTIIGGTIELGREGFAAIHSAKITLRDVTIIVGKGQKSLDGVTVLKAEGLGRVELRDTDVEVASDKTPGEAMLADTRGPGKIAIEGGEFKGRFRFHIDFTGEIRVTDTDLRGVVEGDGTNIKGVTAVTPAAKPTSADPLAEPAKAPPESSPAPQPKAAPAPKSQPTAKAQTTRPRCNCKPGDLMCAQKCRR